MSDTIPMPRKSLAAGPMRRRPSHPGELMAEILDHLRLPTAEAARRMGVGKRSLEAVLGGERPVTAAIALRFGKLAGSEPAPFVRMQVERDLYDAREALRDDLARIKTVRKANAA
jgi:addiction module HigA family antidote